MLGSEGFIGKRVAARFLGAGHRVLGVDLMEAPRGAAHEYARSDPEGGRLAELAARWRPEVLVMAAGRASVPQSMEDPWGDFQGSAALLFRTLEALRLGAPGCRVVFLSSAAVYGDATTLPIGEDHPRRPISPYGYHKLICEKILEEYHRVFGLPSCSLRIFSAYGPGLRRQVLWDICRKAREARLVSLFGTGRETRDFVHVDDIAQAVEKAVGGAAFAAEAYNLASGRDTSIADLARSLLDHLGLGNELAFSDQARPGDPLRWRADISRLAGLGFSPRVELARGLADYAAWVRGLAA